MSARDEAVKAMKAAYDAAFKRRPVPTPQQLLAETLDGIPADVLVRYLVDRGGLKAVEGAWWDVAEQRHYDNLGASRQPWRPEDTPLYCIAGGAS